VTWRKLLTVEWAYPAPDEHCALLPLVAHVVEGELSTRVGFRVELRFPDGSTEHAEAWMERDHAASRPDRAHLWLERRPVPAGTEVWVDEEDG
jgi:hypothetical protein